MSRRRASPAVPATVVEMVQTYYAWTWASRKALIKRLTSDSGMASVFQFLESFNETHQRVFIAAAIEALHDGAAARKLRTEARALKAELVTSLSRTRNALKRLEQLQTAPVGIASSGLEMQHDMVRKRDATRFLASQRWHDGVISKAGCVVDEVDPIELPPTIKGKARKSRVAGRVARNRALRSTGRVARNRALRSPIGRYVATFEKVEAALARLPRLKLIEAMLIASRHPYAEGPRPVTPLELVTEWEKAAESWEPTLFGGVDEALARTAHRRNEYVRSFWHLLNYPPNSASCTEVVKFEKTTLLLKAIVTTANIALDDPTDAVELKDVRNALKVARTRAEDMAETSRKLAPHEDDG